MKFIRNKKRAWLSTSKAFHFHVEWSTSNKSSFSLLGCISLKRITFLCKPNSLSYHTLKNKFFYVWETMVAGLSNTEQQEFYQTISEETNFRILLSRKIDSLFLLMPHFSLLRHFFEVRFRFQWKVIIAKEPFGVELRHWFAVIYLATEAIL